MSIGDWTKGYNAAVDYTYEFQNFLIPDRLILACMMQGFKPSASILSGGREDERKLVYCELGCGQGLTLNLMAARDPGGRYFGLDYSPNQIANARAFAEAGDIANVTFLEESFEDLSKLDIPDCDVIVMHGIWTWVSKEMQDHILSFMRRKLKPGGICYVSYNCMVGRNDFPLRELLRVAERTSSVVGEEKRVEDAVEFAIKVAEGGAGYFQGHPIAKTHLDGLLEYKTPYIMHEYLNANWSPTFFHDVSASMAQAKLTFAGQVDHIRNRIDFVLPPEAMAFRDRLSSVEDTEFLKDMWHGNTFRKDIYVKGTRRITLAEFEQIVAPLRFARVKKAEELTLEVPTLRGKFNMSSLLFTPIHERLKKGIITGAELTDLARQHGQNIVEVLQLLFIAGQIALCVDEDAVERVSESCSKFDNAIWASVERGEELFIASLPGLGSGVNLGLINYLMWRATQTGQKDRAGWVFSFVKKMKRALHLKDETITEHDQIRAYLIEHEIEYDYATGSLVNAGMDRSAPHD
jgi:SAM-dependent methyltransferase